MRRIAAAVLCLLAACAPSKPPVLGGTPLDPPRGASDFTLTDQNGASFAFSRLRGRPAALYFGFTHCKDVCPQTLALLGKARSNAGLSARQFAIVMVTVDPSHDTPAALKLFFEKIRVDAVGLTGTRAQVAPVYRAYGIEVAQPKRDIVHTDAIFVVDGGGMIREILDPQTSVRAIAQDFKTIERAGAPGVH